MSKLNGFKFSSRSSFKSYSEKNDSDQQFCNLKVIQFRIAIFKKDFSQMIEKTFALEILPRFLRKVKDKAQKSFILVDFKIFSQTFIYFVILIDSFR